MLYWDTSALVKQFIEEPGTDEAPFLAHRISAPCDGDDYLHRDLLGTASARKGIRTGNAQVRRNRVTFFTGLAHLCADESGRGRLARSKALLERYPLRTLNAIHLASAIELQSHLEEPSVLISADTQLLKAAAAERLEIKRLSL